ncbi:MAG: hypothetical protein R3F55_18020 [Alphaproteobacteria bacterium]
MAEILPASLGTAPPVPSTPAAPAGDAAVPRQPAADTAAAQGRTGQQAPAPAPTQAPVQPGTAATVASSTFDLASLPSPATLAGKIVAVDSGAQSARVEIETALGRLTVTVSGSAGQPGAAVKLLVGPGGTVRLQPVPGQQPAANAPAAAPGAATAGDVVQGRLRPAGTNTAGAAPSGGTPLAVRIVTVQQPGSQAVQGQAAAGAALTAGSAGVAPPAGGVAGQVPQLVSGVATQSAGGQSLLVTENGTIQIEGKTLPAGARVQLELLPSGAPAARAAPAIAAMAEAMDDMLAALAALQPALAAGIAEQRVPRFGPRMTAGVMFLLSALQGGGARGWMGAETEQALLRGGRDGLLQRIRSAMGQQATRVETDPASGAGEVWRSVYLPLATVEGWQPLRVAWRESAERQDEDEQSGMRFQVDFSFSRLGPIRLDGLAGPGRLDLLLVSRTAMPAATRDELGTLFDDTIGAMGLNGHLRFVQQAELPPPAVSADPRHAEVTA